MIAPRQNPRPIPRTPRSLASVALVFALLLLGGATVAAAQPKPHPVMSDFQPDGQYTLVIDGATVEDARILLSRRAAAMLLLDPQLPAPLLVWARSGRIDSIPASSLLERSDEGLDVADNAPRTYLGDLHLDNTDIVLAVEGKDVRLRPRPPLVGLHDLAELLAHSADYGVGLAAYTPDEASLARLRNATADVRIRIYFGSWCGVCKRYLPNALRVERELVGAKIRFEHYGLDNPPAGWEDPEVKEKGVTGLPAAVVYRGDQEIGRLIGAKDFASPERALLGIVEHH